MDNKWLISGFALVCTVCIAASVAVHGGNGAGTMSVAALAEGTGSRAAASLASPQTVRLVLDAGHGGMDGGAVGVTGLLEKDVNLAVTQYASEILTLLGVPVTLTREADCDLSGLGDDAGATVRERKRLDLAKRVELVNRCENAMLVSIHMNNFTESKYSGAQVFFTTAHGDMRPLGEQLQAALTAALDPENTRQAKPAEGDIYLLERAERPAILMEGGFLSNPGEEARLRTDRYRVKMAAVLSSVLCAYRPEGL